MKVRWPLLKFYLLLTILTIADCQIAHYKKIIVEDKDALCLDGSYGVYYISEGKSL